MQLHLDNNTLEPLARMLQIMYNARKKLIFRTLRLMAIQEQKDTRKDREKYKL